jgi:starch synthase
VRGIGGLKDTIINYGEENSTGFMFYEPSPEALLSVIRKALLVRLEAKKEFSALISRGMKQKFTWETAAEKYSKVYSDLKSH